MYLFSFATQNAELTNMNTKPWHHYFLPGVTVVSTSMRTTQGGHHCHSKLRSSLYRSSSSIWHFLGSVRVSLLPSDCSHCSSQLFLAASETISYKNTNTVQSNSFISGILSELVAFRRLLHTRLYSYYANNCTLEQVTPHVSNCKIKYKMLREL